MVVSFILISLLLMAASVVAVVLFRFVWTSPARFRSVLINLSLSALVFLYLLLAMEAYFRFSHDQSDGLSVTAASKRWFERYWTPINEYGYRDRSYADEDFSGKKTLFVVGDSFTAGQGIRDASERFPDLIQKKLGKNWVVVNIAKRGWNTVDEFRALTAYPHTADIVVLAYFVNDIESVARQCNVPAPAEARPKNPSPVLQKWLERSSALDYTYWIVRKAMARSVYGDYLERCYANATVWQAHKAELLEFVTYCRGNDIELVVAAFPMLNNIAESGRYTAQVTAFFEEHGAKAINLAPHFKDRPPGELVASSLDMHPNELVHAEVAHLILSYMGDGLTP